MRVLPNHIRINDNNLCQVDTTKFLGLHIDKELTWKTHINYLSKFCPETLEFLTNLNTFSYPHFTDYLFIVDITIP